MDNSNSDKCITFEEWIYDDDKIIFPYEDYRIIGDMTELDKVVNTCGFINLNVADITSVLSTETANYVSVGFGEGMDGFVGAMKDAWSKLPVGIDCISRMLVNIWISKSYVWSKHVCGAYSDYLVKDIPSDMYYISGFAYDESLHKNQVKVSLIASSK